MCTAISWKAGSHYFGRNLDLEAGYGEHIAYVPRNMPLRFHAGEVCESHFALIGTAHIVSGYPLFYDGMNERGLCIAALSFPENACYTGDEAGIACYEIALYLLSMCASAAEAEALIRQRGINGAPFSDTMPAAPLHFMIADEKRCLAVEPMADGVRIHDNPTGVMTNNPPFEFQAMNLNNYLNLSPRAPKNRFAPGLELQAYSRAMGAIGLPGDFSSQSRFVKAAFVKNNSPILERRDANLMQFFHMLGSVVMPLGSVILENGRLDKTIYSCCFDVQNGVYYYRTYENSLIHAVDMRRENPDSDQMSAYPMIHNCRIRLQN